jgi:hypothetical protein
MLGRYLQVEAVSVALLIVDRAAVLADVLRIEFAIVGGANA